MYCFKYKCACLAPEDTSQIPSCQEDVKSCLSLPAEQELEKDYVCGMAITDSSLLSLFPISLLIAPWTTSTLQSSTHLTHILRQVSEPISTPLIMCPVNVKLNRRNMEFPFPWVHSPERSPVGVQVGIIRIEFSVIASLCAFPQYLVLCK